MFLRTAPLQGMGVILTSIRDPARIWGTGDPHSLKRVKVPATMISEVQLLYFQASRSPANAVQHPQTLERPLLGVKISHILPKGDQS